jgi:hypothetical protein
MVRQLTNLPPLVKGSLRITEESLVKNGIRGVFPPFG